jgi:hypothetical protein
MEGVRSGGVQVTTALFFTYLNNYNTLFDDLEGTDREEN